LKDQLVCWYLETMSAYVDSDDDSEGMPRLDLLQENLSADTLSLLLQFMGNGEFEADENDEAPCGQISSNSVVAAYTANDISVISQTFSRLEQTHSATAKAAEIALKERVLLPLQSTARDNAVNDLSQLGIVRIDNVLSESMCSRCLSDINAKLRINVENSTDAGVDNGFGGILIPINRWDMYLPYDSMYAEALRELLSPSSILGGMFKDMFGEGLDSSFHEFSSLISDCGASSQPIHPDTVYTSTPPLYTVFVSLQDIDEDMGPTIFLPGTNTAESHRLFKNSTTKNDFLSSREYRQGVLRRGDCAVMDSRTLHCGDANYKSRRVLLYFTVRNPLFQDEVGSNYTPPVGSKFESVEINMSDFACS
jgi:hypothetical protein